MGTALFLILITLCAAFVRKDEAVPALIYCLISFLFYFACKDITSYHIYLVAMLTEAFLVVSLTCFKNCIKSKLVGYLIRASYLAAVMHFFGFLMNIRGYDPDIYNEMVVVYWSLIIILFLSVGNWWNGALSWLNSLFRLTDNNHKNV